MNPRRSGSRYVFAIGVVLALFLALGVWPQGSAIRPDVAQAKLTEWMADPAADRTPLSLGLNNPGIQAAVAVQNRHTRGLMTIPEVVGTAVGHTENGVPAVLVFLKEAAPPGRLPVSLEGVPVEAKVTGAFVAMKPPPGKGGGGIDPTARFDRPVPIGVSTGNIGECSAGTISARVKSGATFYALSNNHVYALENEASIGSVVLQPGRYDTSCLVDSNNEIGSLSAFVPIVFGGTTENRVDAAIAETTSDLLSKATPADGYGMPKSSTTTASLNMAVQKYGRTTQLTKGTITAVNATINVGYSSGTALFVGQIVVTSGKPFIKAGDSGSLLVTDPGRAPVGLLFAGTSSGKYAIANQIGEVLGAFGVTIDGE